MYTFLAHFQIQILHINLPCLAHFYKLSLSFVNFVRSSYLFYTLTHKIPCIPLKRADQDRPLEDKWLVEMKYL